MGKFFTGFVHVVKHIMKPFFPVKWYGPRKFEQKRTILVGNHISGWDPVVFSIWCRTPVSFMYKAEFQKSCFLRAVFNGLDFIPVHRGEVDIAATKRTLKLLRQEKIVALFPEGTRSPDVDKMLPLKTGAALFAIRTKTPIRPYYIWEKAKLFRKNYYYVGDEFTLEQYYDQPITKEMLVEATEIIAERMTEVREKMLAILQEKGIKRRKRTKKELKKLEEFRKQQEESQQ